MGGLWTGDCTISSLQSTRAGVRKHNFLHIDWTLAEIKCPPSPRALPRVAKPCKGFTMGSPALSLSSALGQVRCPLTSCSLTDRADDAAAGDRVRTPLLRQNRGCGGDQRSARQNHYACPVWTSDRQPRYKHHAVEVYRFTCGWQAAAVRYSRCCCVHDAKGRPEHKVQKGWLVRRVRDPVQ